MAKPYAVVQKLCEKKQWNYWEFFAGKEKNSCGKKESENRKTGC